MGRRILAPERKATCFVRLSSLFEIFLYVTLLAFDFNIVETVSAR